MTSNEERDKLVKLDLAFDPLAYSFETCSLLFDTNSDRFWQANMATGQCVELYDFSIGKQIEGAVLVSLIIAVSQAF